MFYFGDDSSCSSCGNVRQQDVFLFGGYYVTRDALKKLERRIGEVKAKYGSNERLPLSGAVPNLQANVITNADQGTLLSWEADTPPYCSSSTNGTCNEQVPAVSAFAIAATSGGSASGPFSVYISGQATPLYLTLQLQDGSYAGWVGVGPSPGSVTQNNMVVLTGSGVTRWSEPNDYPQIATEDGGVIGSSGTTYDNQGRATGQGALPGTPSWQGFMYSVAGDPVVQRSIPPNLFLQANPNLLDAAGWKYCGHRHDS
jgi:hypothetical protein